MIDKVCTKCNNIKSVDYFYNLKKSKDGLSYWCNTCMRQAKKEERIKYKEKSKQKDADKYIKHKQKILLKAKITYHSDKEKQRDRQLRKKYGITLIQWNEMYEKQSGNCALCLRHQSELKRRLNTDHNHKSGHVRALLCTYCNRYRVGRLNLKWAKAIYEYLIKYDKDAA